VAAFGGRSTRTTGGRERHTASDQWLVNDLKDKDKMQVNSSELQRHQPKQQKTKRQNKNTGKTHTNNTNKLLAFSNNKTRPAQKAT
jgi:hypothetical protein